MKPRPVVKKSTSVKVSSEVLNSTTPPNKVQVVTKITQEVSSELSQTNDSIPEKRSNKRRRPQVVPSSSSQTPEAEDSFSIKPTELIIKEKNKNFVAPNFLKKEHPSSRPTIKGSTSIDLLTAFDMGSQRDAEYEIQVQKRQKSENLNKQRKWEKSHPVRHDLFAVESASHTFPSSKTQDLRKKTRK